MCYFKNILIGSVFGVCLFVDVNAYPFVSDINSLSPLDENDARLIFELKHDWECNYIIEDSYHQERRFHFVNDYVENVDASISFVDDNGQTWQIPAPYYWIYKNSKNSH